MPERIFVEFMMTRHVIWKVLMYLMSFAMVHKNPFWHIKKGDFIFLGYIAWNWKYEWNAEVLSPIYDTTLCICRCLWDCRVTLVLCQFSWSGTSYDISKFVCNQNCLWEQKRLNVPLLNPRLRTKAGGKGISGRCHNKVKVEAASQNHNKNSKLF